MPLRTALPTIFLLVFAASPAESLRKKLVKSRTANVAEPSINVREEGDEEPDKCQKCLDLCEKAPFGKDRCKKGCEKLCGLRDEAEKCAKTLLAFKGLCGLMGDRCDACVESGMAKLQDACGEKVDRLAPLICKQNADDEADEDAEADMEFRLAQEEDDEDPHTCQNCLDLCEKAPFGKDICKKGCEKICGLQDEAEKCAKTLLAFKGLCGLMGDRCNACVENGMAKLQDACGDKVDRLAPLICKQNADDDDDADEDDEADMEFRLAQEEDNEDPGSEVQVDDASNGEGTKDPECDYSSDQYALRPIFDRCIPQGPSWCCDCIRKDADWPRIQKKCDIKYWNACVICPRFPGEGLR